MGRRGFLRSVGTLAGAAGALALASACGLDPRPSPTERVARVGVLAYDDGTSSRWAAFRAGLRALHWVEDHSIALVWRVANAHTERLPGLARQLVQQSVDVIVAGGTQAALAARDSTSAIPIVVPALNDPIGSGFVFSFSRPGGNVTGSTSLSPELTPKWLELVVDVLPGVSRVAVLVDPDNPSHTALVEQARASAMQSGLRIQTVEAHDAGELEKALSQTGGWSAEALVVLPDMFFFTERAHIADVLLRRRLPAIHPARDYVVAGGLMSYGADPIDLYRRAASQVDHILRGASPAEIPVEQPSHFDLVVNASILQAMTLTVPSALQPLVTEWIQ